MTQPNLPLPENLTIPVEQKFPTPLWIAVGALGLITLLTLFSATHRNLAVMLVTVVLNLALLGGLIRGHKWAYVLTILFSVAGVAVSFKQSASQGLIVLLGDAVVLVPVLLSTHYFFPSRKPMDSSRKP